MKFGVCIPNYGETFSVDGMRTVAVEAERMGYDSLWTTDHILMPQHSGTPYETVLDSITSLAYLAAHTTVVKLGISSLILAMRNPVIAIKQLATVDQLSRGRLMLATSAGWNELEFAHLGADFHIRGKRLDESIRLIRKLWTAEANVDFEAKVLPNKIGQAIFQPKPIQKHLTIWIAGASEAAMKRAIELGDAWHPNVSPLDTFKPLVERFKALPGGNKKPICVRIALNTKVEDPILIGPQGDRRLVLSKNMTENQKTISELAKLGVSHMLLTPSPTGTTPVTDQVASLRSISEHFIRNSAYIA
ncbi:MAG TPA: TIGR03619 family F420-dependent LLM class oxidoreductase [Candidatus Dormibacteraeota bacterium]|nr:TIGR03619 family F420-dependent LLM class oxidoreductase [Candidatus Dormibacteraeota bacterium]